MEACGPVDATVDELLGSRPELVFNVAEGEGGAAREATFPAVLETLGLPYTGSRPALLFVDLDKRVTARLLAERGIRVPSGVLLTPDHDEPLDGLEPPLIVKPNAEGSSKGITQESVVESGDEARGRAEELLEHYPAGVLVEEMIRGRELVVPYLEAWPDRLLEPVEHHFPEGRHDIYDYDLKRSDDVGKVETVSPVELDDAARRRVEELSRRAFEAMPCRDLGRVDLRLTRNGEPVLIEVNPLPALAGDASFMIGARASGLDYRRTIELVLLSAVRRWGLALRRVPWIVMADRADRPAARELGVEVGTISTGIGEMSGLTQVLHWGWLETPILLTNTLSVGLVHSGIIRYMLHHHPELGKKVDVTIPVVAETNDGFLNDVRIPVNTADKAVEAIESASGGPVPQGSVGAGTGIISFDFAGGIGTSSRRLPDDKGGHTVGVLVQANFGKMRSLTVDGRVVGRELDALYPTEGRRGRQYGSVIVVVATDAPLLSTQLSSLSARAALGLGRVGSFGRSTSGEIVCAFSTGNKVPRTAKKEKRHLDLVFVNDELVNPLYEATVEATEEAVLNALFCSAGQTGREGRIAPPLPVDAVLELLARGRDLPSPIARVPP